MIILQFIIGLMYQRRQINQRARSSRRVYARPAFIVFLAFAFVVSLWHEAPGQKSSPRPQKSTPKSAAQPAPEKAIPLEVMMRIVRAEDERRWDNDLGILLFDKNARIRERAALAAGRIGDERSVASLIAMLQTDGDASVRARAAFALGEVESPTASAALLEILKKESGETKARIVEALGKIAPAIPKTDEAGTRAIGEAILKVLDDELKLGTKPNREVILEGLTATLRARPTGAGIVVMKFLSSTDARVRADAANTLARLRAKEGSEKLRALLASDPNGVVRANAARALGAAEDAASLDALAARVTKDDDERVRVSAIRSLAALKDARAAAPLITRAAQLMPSYRAAKTSAESHPHEVNELLEIAVALGRMLANTNDERAVQWLRSFRETEQSAPEVESSFARIAPFTYLREAPFSKQTNGSSAHAALMKNWKRVSAIAQGMAEIAGISATAAGSGIVGLQADAQITLRSWLDDPTLPAQATPDVLRALAAFKANDLAVVLRKQMAAKDVIVRATAAELLGELQPDEATTRVLSDSLPAAMRDELNDAVLAILDSLAKQKTTAANDAIKTLLDSQDYLVRRRAVALLKANGAGDFSQRLTNITSRNTKADYDRALARLGTQVRAVVNTDKGAFTIELLADDAPLNVDNFVQLARRNYFNGITFHRVVPNFVVQGGDPRGDGNGGPGYQIRCEINEVEYERGAVGMALSGKDTGGSQWFVTHSPQPHLDGGYTVFGRVSAGMDVVDRITRGDLIRSITIAESARSASKTENAPRKEAQKKRT
jgi:cyclophilin family peptidyl-prolyl cis-trans isomerase/HEAT repeat protein